MKFKGIAFIHINDYSSNEYTTQYTTIEDLLIPKVGGQG